MTAFPFTQVFLEVYAHEESISCTIGASVTYRHGIC